MKRVRAFLCSTGMNGLGRSEICNEMLFKLKCSFMFCFCFLSRKVLLFYLYPFLDLR